MARRGVKRREGEDFSHSTMKRVISALESDKPITKKAACEILNINYNTTRLNKIIEEFKDKEAFARERRKQLRGKPIDNGDKRYMIEAALSRTPISEISEITFRSTSVIKNVLKEYNIPLHTASVDYFNPVFLEGDFAEDYAKDDLVYSARYDAPAYIVKKIEPGVYRIAVLGAHAQYAVQPFYELGDLRKVQKEFGLKVDELSSDEIKELIYEGLKKVKKKANDK